MGRFVTDKRPQFKLTIKRIVGNPIILPDGRTAVKVIEEEVEKVNLGSYADPNRNIHSFKLEPIRYDDEDEKEVY